MIELVAAAVLSAAESIHTGAPGADWPAAGVPCFVVFDLGNLTAPASYPVTVAHP